MRRRFAAILLVMFSGPLAAQWLMGPTPGIPRTADGGADLSAPAPQMANGRVDLSGLWAVVRESGDLRDPTKVQPWAQEIIAERQARFYQDQPRYRCLPSGPRFISGTSTSAGLRRIVQHPSVIAILHDDMAWRQIFLDGRELEEDPLPSWMGYSVGRWEDDTLIVDSNGYNDKTWLHLRGMPHTGHLRITERYRRPDFGHILLDVTYDDPGLADEPLRAEFELRYAVDNELAETVCVETLETPRSWDGAVSEAERRAVEVDPEILAGYVGTYEGEWLGNTITLEITLQDGELAMKRNGVDMRLIAQSERTFDGSNGFAYIFNPGEDGIATEVSEEHVSGGWWFPRVE